MWNNFWFFNFWKRPLNHPVPVTLLGIFGQKPDVACLQMDRLWKQTTFVYSGIGIWYWDRGLLASLPKESISMKVEPTPSTTHPSVSSTLLVWNDTKKYLQSCKILKPRSKSFKPNFRPDNFLSSHSVQLQGLGFVSISSWTCYGCIYITICCLPIWNKEKSVVLVIELSKRRIEYCERKR